MLSAITGPNTITKSIPQANNVRNVRKSFMHLVLFLVMISGMITLHYAQPNYTLTAKNFILNSATQFQFDIYLTRTGGGTEPYVQGEFFLSYNPTILPKDISIAYLDGSTGFPGIPYQNCIALLFPHCILEIAVATYSNGITIPVYPSEIRVGTYLVTNSIAFYSDAELGATWRVFGQQNYTRIWYNSTPEETVPTLVELPISNYNYVVEGGDLLLPVEVLLFTVTARGRNVKINWQTKTEVNNYGFEIERSTDKVNWNKIAFINGYGNSNSPKQYSYIDDKISYHNYYYRLKQIDTDGAFAYSKIVELTIETITLSFELEQNYPNPFNPKTAIGFGIPETGNVRLSVLNILGEEIKILLNEEKEAGYHSIDFNASDLPSAVYFYRLQSGNFIDTKKMILLK